MKKVNKSDSLQEFEDYVKKYPNNTWKNFQDDCSETYKRLIELIKKDQGGLCCYCETNFYEEGFPNTDDFRVEHFHPKSDSTPSKNWHLDWNNLLGCCHGGSVKYLHNETKFIKEHKHRHSDILKGENPWGDEILNPLIEIPAFPPFFRVNSDGTMIVIEENCNALITKASNCVDPEMLNLNTEKLKDFRATVIDKLREELDTQVQSGMDMDDVLNTLSNIYLSKNDEKYFPFFTTIRSFLGKNAEEFLSKNDYDG